MNVQVKPVISLLLVAVLGCFLFGSYLAEEISSIIFGIWEAFLPLLVILFILLILMVIFMNDLVVIPLALSLGLFSLRIGPLGPLLLLFVILFFEKYLQSRRPSMVYRSTGCWLVIYVHLLPGLYASLYVLLFIFHGQSEASYSIYAMICFGKPFFF